MAVRSKKHCINQNLREAELKRSVSYEEENRGWVTRKDAQRQKPE